MEITAESGIASGDWFLKQKLALVIRLLDPFKRTTNVRPDIGSIRAGIADVCRMDQLIQVRRAVNSCDHSFFRSANSLTVPELNYRVTWVGREPFLLAFALESGTGCRVPTWCTTGSSTTTSAGRFSVVTRRSTPAIR